MIIWSDFHCISLMISDLIWWNEKETLLNWDQKIKSYYELKNTSQLAKKISNIYSYSSIQEKKKILTSIEINLVYTLVNNFLQLKKVCKQSPLKWLPCISNLFHGRFPLMKPDRFDWPVVKKYNFKFLPFYLNCFLLRLPIVNFSRYCIKNIFKQCCLSDHKAHKFSRNTLH